MRALPESHMAPREPWVQCGVPAADAAPSCMVDCGGRKKVIAIIIFILIIISILSIIIIISIIVIIIIIIIIIISIIIIRKLCQLLRL